MGKESSNYVEAFARLESIRHEKGISSQRQFAQQYLNVSEQTYWNWSKRGVPAQAIIDCANRLKVSVDSLLGREAVEYYGDHPLQPGPTVLDRYPLLGTVPAGDFREAIERATMDPTTQWLPSPKRLPDGGFYLRVSGSSMNPTLADGDVILVDPSATPIHRSIVVVRNGSSEATVKRLIKDGETWALVPDNPQFQAKPLGDCEIVGVVVFAQRDLSV
ncbi:S24 family peptidase [Acidithiobacillus caldus]|jgi:SOS-response transcriptional repressor LexA|uniref:S24 family peptidase n=1 Tax=Acidithiobacillus caldus TaxID=33059 RepID=UPI0009838998|nr:S24 family peptidase [Acidithiobacillus caldus]MBU2783709.1 hypothetical protein [Acidithiobacillus caldus]